LLRLFLPRQAPYHGTSKKQICWIWGGCRVDDICRAPSKSRTVLLDLSGSSQTAWATSSQLYLRPQPVTFFFDVTPHSPFKAVAHAARHPFHSLESVCLVMENLTDAAWRIPQASSLPSMSYLRDPIRDCYAYTAKWDEAIGTYQ
jgi:hypothetical protein